jgi:hypothetical protein
MATPLLLRSPPLPLLSFRLCYRNRRHVTEDRRAAYRQCRMDMGSYRCRRETHSDMASRQTGRWMRYYRATLHGESRGVLSWPPVIRIAGRTTPLMHANGHARQAGSAEARAAGNVERSWRKSYRGVAPPYLPDLPAKNGFVNWQESARPHIPFRLEGPPR